METSLANSPPTAVVSLTQQTHSQTTQDVEMPPQASHSAASNEEAMQLETSSPVKQADTDDSEMQIDAA